HRHLHVRPPCFRRKRRRLRRPARDWDPSAWIARRPWNLLRPALTRTADEIQCRALDAVEDVAASLQLLNGDRRVSYSLRSHPFFVPVSASSSRSAPSSVIRGSTIKLQI